MAHDLQNARVYTIVTKVSIDDFTLSRPLVYSANGGAEGASVENAPWAPKIIPYKKKENWN